MGSSKELKIFGRVRCGPIELLSLHLPTDTEKKKNTKTISQNSWCLGRESSVKAPVLQLHQDIYMQQGRHLLFQTTKTHPSVKLPSSTSSSVIRIISPGLFPLELIWQSLGRHSALSQGWYRHRTTQIQKKSGQSSMPQVEFEPTIPAFWASECVIGQTALYCDRQPNL